MYIFNIFMLHQTVKTSVSQRESDFHTCPLPEVLEGDSPPLRASVTFYFSSKVKMLLPFAERHVAIKLCLQEGSLAPALPRPSRVWSLLDSLFFYFITSLPAWRIKVRYGTIFDPWLWLDRKNLNQEEMREVAVRGDLSINYGFYDRLKGKKSTGEERCVLNRH